MIEDRPEQEEAIGAQAEQAAAEEEAPSWSRDRKGDLAESGLHPNVLVGSWFMFNDGAEIWKGMVVGAPVQAPTASAIDGTVFLCQFESDRDSRRHQRLVDAGTMISQEWHFFDTEEWMEQAYQERDLQQEVR